MGKVGGWFGHEAELLACMPLAGLKILNPSPGQSRDDSVFWPFICPEHPEISRFQSRRDLGSPPESLLAQPRPRDSPAGPGACRCLPAGCPGLCPALAEREGQP